MTNTYRAVKCPCGHPNCRSGNLSPVTYGQGAMLMVEAEEIAKKLNAYPKLVETIQLANAMIFSVGAPLGSERYFLLRELFTSTLSALGHPATINGAVNKQGAEILAFLQRVSLFSAFEVPDEDSVAGLRRDAADLYAKLIGGDAL